MKRVFCAVALLILVSSFLAFEGSMAQGTSASEITYSPCENRTAYPIMRIDSETFQEWSDLYNSAPRAYLSSEFIPQTGSFSLLDHLEYTPAERDQGSTGSCWVWTSTGILEVALDVQEGIRDRLSVQYFASGWHMGTAYDWAGCPGQIFWFAEWHQNKGFAIPWSNTNAQWQDGDRMCEDGTSVPFNTISTTPNYPLSRCTAKTIETHNVGQTQAVNNIKNVLRQNKAVWFSFGAPNTDDWNAFVDFWVTQSENAIWNPDYMFGHTWNEDEAGGHAVLCVGYNDVDPDNPYWIMVNSWGTADGRPNGIFLVDMDMNYNCTLDFDGTNDYNLEWATLDVAFVHSETLSYDDGTLEVTWHWTGSGGMSAVKFTPRVAGQLTEFSFYISSDPVTVNVHVLDKDRDIIKSFSCTPASANWRRFLLDSPIDVSSGVDFYLAVEWTVANKPYIGCDTSDPDGRSYNWNGLQWSQCADWDYLIRTIIKTVRQTELYYDDGTSEYGGWSSEVLGWMAAVRFTPLITGRLVECSFYIDEDPAIVKIHAFDGRGGVMASFSYTPTSAGWCYIDLSAYKITVSSGVDFYVAIEWRVSKKPYLGFDISHPDDRSLGWNGAEWSLLMDRDWLIRAVVAAEVPDLIVSDISWSPTYPKEGEKVTFTVYVRNQGARDAGSFKIWYRIAGPAGSLGPEYSGNLSITSLSAGKTVNATFTWSATEGSDYSVQARADIGGSIAEIVENNNEKTIVHAFPVAPKPKPDLIISDISWAPEKPVESATVTFNITIKNNGTANAGSFKVAYYIDGASKGEWSITGLLTGQSTAKTFTWTAVEGTHTIKAFADSGNTVNEQVETNNELEKAFQVAPKPKPDLVISSISWMPETPVEGNTVTFTVTIKNNGTVNAASFKTTYYINTSKLGEWSITSLSSGQELNKTFTWTYIEGSHKVKAIADSNGGIQEDDETNNEREEIIGNLPPEASFSCNGCNYMSNPITYLRKTTIFDATESYDPEGSIVSYCWDFGDGNITTVTDPTVSHNYTRTGNYKVTLNVTDNLGMLQTASGNVTVKLQCDVNNDGIVNVLDVTAVSIAYKSKPGDQNWNPNVDFDNDQNITILDVTTVARDYGEKA